MKKSIIYISLFIALLGLCSCSMKEQFDMVSSESTIQFVPRITGFNGVDVATKADGDAPAFETDVYTAYLLIFDNNGNRVYFASVDEDNGSWSQKVTMTNLTSGTACFIANVPQTFAEGIATITDLNSAVLTLTYATYSEAGGYLGVPKLSVNGEYKLCLPMFGSTQISNMTHNHTFSIPVKRLFAKISVDLSLNVNLSDLQSAIQTLTNYELSYFNLHNLPNKVRLVEDANSESTWKDGSGNPATFQSADVDAKIYNSTSSMEQKSYSFDCYVPEFYLNPKSGWTNDQRYKPLNKPDGTYPIYLELVGQYNAYAISPTDINYKVYLGSDNVSNFSLSRNTHYNNVLTIKGTNQNSTTQDNLDHRVTSSTINNPVAKAGKAANCYIIAEPGEYTIPAYKGAYNNLNEGVFCMEGKNLSEYETRVEVLANVVEYESITSISFSIPPTYDPETNTISFTVNKMLADNWVPNGSVIMALQYRKKGTTTWTTEWSWHLWFVYSITAAEDGWGTIGYQTMPDGTTNMMDRNLGVHAFTSADTKAGFYYKYGEHAPYLDPDGDEVYTQYGGGSISDATPVWSSSKSVTDPCPPGYKVPNSSVWSKTNGTAGTIVDAFIYWNSGTQYIYYPYSGYLDSNNKLISEIVENTFTKFKADDYKPLGAFSKSFNTDVIDGEPVQETDLNQKRTQTYTENKLSAFEYEVFMSLSDIGRVWSANNACLAYNARDNKWASLKITLCKLSTRTVTRTQRRVRAWVPGYTDFSQWPPKWIAGHYSDYGTWENLGGWENGSWSSETTVTEQTQLPVIGTINNEEYRNDLRTHQSLRDFSSMQCSIPTYTNTPTEGYQVRCIKE